ncbi:MAG: peptidylprolyl isomerase [Thermoleophilia bacterium]|nr:peptidylprolyl isomerase [Thermoleophilia bacterium]
MIRRLAIGLLLLPLLMVLGCQSDVPEGVIAQVGMNSVSQEQLDSLKAAYEAAGRAPDKGKQPDEYERFEQALVEYLVALEVMRQKASAFDITITEGDVRDALGQIRQMFQGDDDKFEAALERQGLTLEQMTQSVREGLLLDEMKAAVNDDVTVGEEDVQAYYETHKAEFVEQEFRAVRHILISPFKTDEDGVVSATATQAQWDAAKIEAEKVRSQIQNGADFVSMVEKHSDDNATNEGGGKLGAITRGMLVPVFEEAVFGLQSGDLSEPVKTQYGYHLIEVTDITPEQQLSYDQVMESIRSGLLEQKQEEAWGRWLDKAKAELGVVYRSGYEPRPAGRSSAEGSTTGSAGE